MGTIKIFKLFFDVFFIIIYFLIVAFLLVIFREYIASFITKTSQFFNLDKKDITAVFSAILVIIGIVIFVFFKNFWEKFGGAMVVATKIPSMAQSGNHQKFWCTIAPPFKN